VELFGNDGQVGITDLIFPAQSDKGLGIYAEGAPPLVISLDIWNLKTHAEQRYLTCYFRDAMHITRRELLAGFLRRPGSLRLEHRGDLR
jgi:hypothetical protein